MANDLAKYLNSRRRLRDQAAIKRQTRIAKSHGVPVNEPHKFAKHHAMNCGNPKCVMCGNPRKTFKQLTIQEKRQQQDLDRVTDQHSNGAAPNE